LGCRHDFRVGVSFSFAKEKSDTGVLEKTDLTLLNSFFKNPHQVLAKLNTPLTRGLITVCIFQVINFAADHTGAITQTLATL